MEKRIGKIKAIKFGFGGYQDAQFGVSVVLTSDKDCWSVGDFRGHWGLKRDPPHTKWTEEERETTLGKTCMWVRDLLQAAKKEHLDELVGVPVEVTYDDMMLKEWRILTEVL